MDTTADVAPPATAAAVVEGSWVLYPSVCLLFTRKTEAKKPSRELEAFFHLLTVIRLLDDKVEREEREQINAC
jgi:hypothetical protein